MSTSNTNCIDNASEVVLRILLCLVHWWLGRQYPFVRHVDIEQEVWMYRYPYVGSYVRRTHLLMMLTAATGMLLTVEYLVHQRTKEMVNDMRVFSLASCLTAVISSSLKVAVGRPRPNFYYRCFPDAHGDDLQHCTGDINIYMDGRKSFPSSHASLSFAVMTVVCVRLYHLLNLKDSHSTGKGWRLCLCLVPLSLATAVSVSRTCDYNHHYSDVIAGALIGTTIACLICYVYGPDINDFEQLEKPINVASP